MRCAHFVHGFNVSDGGTGTTDTLIPYFEPAFKVVQHDYGWLGLLGTRFCNRGIATQVAAQASRDDVGVGHSNGCAILAMAADMGAPFRGLVLINPALDEDWVFPSQLRWVHVYYNQGDRPVPTTLAVGCHGPVGTGDRRSPGYRLRLPSRCAGAQRPVHKGRPVGANHRDEGRVVTHWELVIAAALYFNIGHRYFMADDPGLALAWSAYAVANLGFLWSAMRDVPK